MNTMSLRLSSLLYVLNLLYLQVDSLSSDGAPTGHKTMPPITGLESTLTTIYNNPLCTLTLDPYSISRMRHLNAMYEPNLINFNIKFQHSGKTVVVIEETPDIIMPYRWIWTYYTPAGYFPYLQWPVDFGLLSFGLLDAKTLPKDRIPDMYINITSTSPDCSLVLGQFNTTHAIGGALRGIVLNSTAFSNYFCYLAEVPGIKTTLEYKLGIHFGFPVRFYGYNCCRTYDLRLYRLPKVHCINQVQKMWQVVKLPFFVSVFVFFYIPVIILNISGKIVVITKNYYKQFRPNVQNYESLDNQANIRDPDVVYLDGTSPVTISGLLCGICGVADKCPVAVSRLRRLVFLLFGPFLVFLQTSLYLKYDNDIMLSFTEHGFPLGFLSMIAGYERSKTLFMPYFGGPFIFMFLICFLGLLFVVCPAQLDVILYNGTLTRTRLGKHSPLFLSLEMIESLSPFEISPTIGYTRVAVLSKAMFYMILNPNFWCYAIRNQYERLRHRPFKSTVLLILILPIYIGICVLELVVCIVYYGFPFVNCVCVMVTGYAVSTLPPFNALLRPIIVILITSMLMFLIFGFSILYLTNFYFIAKLIVFSFEAVLSYPTAAFGYLFFSIVFLYYIFKICEKFGNAYFELLSDAVDISYQLQMTENNTTRNSNQRIYCDLITDQMNALTPLHQEEIRSNNDQCSRYLIHKNDKDGIPRDLYEILVKKYRPMFKHVIQASLKVLLILALITVTVTLTAVKHWGSTQGFSDLMHVVFVVAIGALPRVLEVALDTINHSVKKDIEIRKMKRTILDYWTNAESEASSSYAQIT